MQKSENSAYAPNALRRIKCIARDGQRNLENGLTCGYEEHFALPVRQKPDSCTDLRGSECGPEVHPLA